MCSSVNRSVKRIWTRYRMTWISNVPSAVVSLAPSDNRSNGFLGYPTFSFSLPSVMYSSGTVHIYIPVSTHSNFISYLSFCFCKFMSYQFYPIALTLNYLWTLRLIFVYLVYFLLYYYLYSLIKISWFNRREGNDQCDRTLCSRCVTKRCVRRAEKI